MVVEAAENESPVTPANIEATVPQNYLLDSSRGLVGQYFVAEWQLTNTSGPLGYYSGHGIVPQSIMQSGLTVPDEVQGNLWTCLEAGKTNTQGETATIYSQPTDIGLSKQLDQQLAYLYHFGYGAESVGKRYDNPVNLSNYAYMQAAVWGYIQQVAGNSLATNNIPDNRNFDLLSAAEIANILKQWKPSALNADISGHLSQDDWAVRTANAMVAERDKKSLKEDLTQTPIQELKKGEIVRSESSSVLSRLTNPAVVVDQAGVSATIKNGQFELTLDENADLKALNNVEVTVTAKGILADSLISPRAGTPPVNPGGDIGIGEGATEAQYASATQKLAIWSDPTSYKGVVTYKVKIIGVGQLQIGKQDNQTGNMVPNTTFEGTIGGEKVSFTTGEDGWAPISNDYIHGSDYSLVETDVPAGYTINRTPITGQIVGGELTKITQRNNQQNAVITFNKTKEIFNAEKTTEEGTPVYEEVPAEGLEFTNKNVNDTTAPDQETVMVPAGEYLDSILTDSEGNGKSNVPFVNGEQNFYIFDEENEPENYREFEAVEYAVPYESNEVAIAEYDLGTFKNELKTAVLSFNKKNDLDLTAILNVPGAEIHIEGISENTKDVNFVFTTTTTTNELKLKAGTYRATEVKYPDGFTLSQTQTAVMIFEIKDKEDIEINWNNTELIPSMGTKAYVNGGGKEFDSTVENVFYDEIEFSSNFEEGKWLVTKLVGERTGTVYDEFDGEVVIDENGKMLVKTVIPANTIQNENVYFDEAAYNDKEKEDLYCKHDGKGDYGQTVFWKGHSSNVSNPSGGTSSGSYPNTGEEAKAALTIMGIVIAAAAGFILLKRKKETV
ncbi:SpaA isopeptide-forming pilin-related protein [Enterococcus sp. BWR-S5]|uniref:SpaA isopeptide-forming pilin-related protein n=1 Tax=Enterococcus sp. BWR-S5 TaxID=2787714 RepID=UPI001924F29C|nr:SpaA isopeptide-forming pilin-related protein [Enterococcus sp. BWR-S5]MBL1227219.1 LPXTG cell wall anchor domain-containing protein [Enterococcus sp. BWR-S5]